ncbi:RNA polymerase sigma factor [Vitiosangium sp. GDMCC 1.1324]|nr:RNA polymerase sigma factor [Vitiosangium sp. GDMCC 1.1324]
MARQHEAALRTTALRLCGNATDAHDLVQDTYERGLRNLAHFRPGSDVRAWLLTILKNRFFDRYRTRTHERYSDTPVEELADRIAAPAADVAPDWASISPEQLLAALEKLPEEFRVTYRLHDIEGRSYNEIAEQLGIPKATVGTRLVRARRKLRELLSPTPQETEA